MRLIYLFELQTLASFKNIIVSCPVDTIQWSFLEGNFSIFRFQVFSFKAVLYLPDHKAYTSAVYRPHGCISSFGMILKKLAGFANVCTGQRMICDAETGSVYSNKAWRVSTTTFLLFSSCTLDVLAFLECTTSSWTSRFHLWENIFYW